MNKSRLNARRTQHQPFGDGMEHLEQRAMLDAAGVRFVAAPLQWHGAQLSEWVQGSWIITFNGEQSRAQADARARQIATAMGVTPQKVVTSALGQFANIWTNDRITESAVNAAIHQFPFLHNVEPDLMRHVDRVPNDATYAQQWPLNNTGQAAGSSGNGVVGADMSAQKAWDITTGSKSVVVAILDTGTDLQHNDLKANLWKNPGETMGNNADDDGDGFVDDIYGWDFANNDNNPQAPNVGEGGHGVAVEGCIGAVGNNGIGVSGINWQVSMITCKIGDEQGNLNNAAIINSLQYLVLLKRRGINIVASCNSYGATAGSQTPYNDAERIAVQGFTDAGMLFVAAAGNDGFDNDGPVTHYPASYDNPYIIAVAATDNQDHLADFSDFGKVTVDVGAPGVQVWTTQLGGGYQYIDGTSFACPYTTGVLALMASVNQFATKESLKAALFASVDQIPALDGKVATNGRVNAFKAVKASRTEGLFVTQITPGTQASNVSEIQVAFSGDITTFNPARIELKRANGASTFNGTETNVSLGAPTTISLTGKYLTIQFAAPLARDLYRLILHADGFLDTHGNQLNGDTTHGNDEVYDFNVVSFRGPYEPNDTTQTATPLILGPSGFGTLDDLYIGDGLNLATDVDIFSVYAPGASLLSVSVRARSLPTFSALDSYLRIFDSGGNEIAHNDNFDGLDSRLQTFVGGAGLYYIAVSAFPNTSYAASTELNRKNNGSSGTYSLDIGVVTNGPEIITRPGTGTPLAIPAQGEIVSTINVTDGRSITDLTVFMHIKHEFMSDLLITLTGPGGDTIRLMDRRGGANSQTANAHGNITFSDDATALISTISPPFDGTFQPEDPLVVFKNRTAYGVWTLRIKDLVPLSDGSLEAWSITFTHVNDINGPFELNDTSLLATPTDIDGTGATTYQAFIGDGAFGLLDVDLYRFVAGSGTTVTLSLNGEGGLRTILRLFDSLGNEIRADRRHAVSSSVLNFVVANAGTYYVGVSGGSDSANTADLGNDNYLIGVGGSGTPTTITGNYTLTVSVAGGISEGPQVLSGTHVSLGIASNGSIGLPTGTSSKGLALDGLDFLLYNDPANNDTPTISSYFSAAFDGFVVRNTSDRSQTDLPMAIANESDFVNRRIVASGVYRGLGVRRTIAFGRNDGFVAIDVALTNRSGLVMNNVAWLEGMGARQGYNLSTDEVAQTLTVNNVRNGSLRLATSSFQSGGSNYTMGLGAAAGTYNVSTGFTDPGVARDPIAQNGSPVDPDSSMADVGTPGQQDMSVSFAIGSLGPSQTVTIRYFLFLGNTVSAVNTMFDTLDSGAGTGHLVADPKSAAIPATSLPYVTYYPEGFANNRASSFLPIVNAGSDSVRVVVIAHYEKNQFNLPASEVLYDSATDEAGGAIAAGARGGITLTTADLYAQGTPNTPTTRGRVKSLIAGEPGVYKDNGYSLEIRSSAPVGAQLSHYDFGGIATGQTSTSTQSNTWTFAAVTRGDSNLGENTDNDFIVFTNPNATEVKVTLTFYGPGGVVATFVPTTPIEANRRGGFAINSLALPIGVYAARLDADLPIIAALTHFNKPTHIGYGTVGLSSAGVTRGATSEGQVGLTATNENVRVFNPSTAPAIVTFTFAFANASAYRRTLNVPAKSTGGFSVSSIVGFPVGQAYSVTYDSTVPVTVSLPVQTTVGTSGSTLTGNASTQWLFADGFKPASGHAVQEHLRVFNPSNLDQTIEISMNYNDGTSEVFRRTVAARATANYDVFSFITGTHSTPGTVPGVGSFYGVRVIAAVPVVAFLGHFDAFLDGGFGSLGTQLGTLGLPA